VVNIIKYFEILMPADGPEHNVFKRKPPITFTINNAREVLFYLQKVLAEDFMKII
jgi:4-aminobutyrate aminotransferase-like enzyme